MPSKWDRTHGAMLTSPSHDKRRRRQLTKGIKSSPQHRPVNRGPEPWENEYRQRSILQAKISSTLRRRKSVVGDSQDEKKADTTMPDAKTHVPTSSSSSASAASALSASLSLSSLSTAPVPATPTPKTRVFSLSTPLSHKEGGGGFHPSTSAPSFTFGIGSQGQNHNQKQAHPSQTIFAGISSHHGHDPRHPPRHPSASSASASVASSTVASSTLASSAGYDGYGGGAVLVSASCATPSRFIVHDSVSSSSASSSAVSSATLSSSSLKKLALNPQAVEFRPQPNQSSLSRLVPPKSPSTKFEIYHHDKSTMAFSPVKVGLVPPPLSLNGDHNTPQQMDEDESEHPSPSLSASLSSLSGLPVGERVERLASFVDLVNRVPAGAFVAFDIDETLIITKGSPSYLLTPKGVLKFQAYVHQSYKDFTTKNKHTRNLQAALQQKELTEVCVAEVIKQLQRKGCFVFGLTARYQEMAHSTQRTLSELDIDFNLTAPFPKQALQDPETEAFCWNGIVYCNNTDKGVVLNRFLENIVFRDLLAKQQAGHRLERSMLPSALFFVDDRMEHASSVLSSLSVARNLGVPVTCYHYIAPAQRSEDEDDRRRERDANLALLQQLPTTSYYPQCPLLLYCINFIRYLFLVF